jgi:hypothetical protein
MMGQSGGGLTPVVELAGVVGLRRRVLAVVALAFLYPAKHCSQLSWRESPGLGAQSRAEEEMVQSVTPRAREKG